MYKRLLVVSNNCFSLENSNGRTLAGFVKGWPAESIAQFYTYNQLPSSNVCKNYFRVTDKQALFSIWKGSVAGKIELNKKTELNKIPQNRLSKFRNPLVLLLRNFIWDLGFWKGKHFNNWINEFNPEIIFLQAGDSSFRLKITTNLAKKRNVPLIIYNSEGYYFKNHNYMTNSGLTGIFYSIFIKNFRKQLTKTIDYASHTIYSCEPLKNDFDRVLNKRSSVIYTASDIKILPNNYTNKKVHVLSYLGNLGLGRHKTLIELANVIQSIDSNLILDVYGKYYTDAVIKDFKNCSAINYKGVISYQDVKTVILQSDILFHVESFSDFYIEDIKYGFSTKIADSLMSGRCFFMYAPESLACSKYMRKYYPKGVASNKLELIEKLTQLLHDFDLRNSYINDCMSTAELFHSSEIVSNLFLNLVNNSN